MAYQVYEKAINHHMIFFLLIFCRNDESYQLELAHKVLERIAAVILNQKDSKSDKR